MASYFISIELISFSITLGFSIYQFCSIPAFLLFFSFLLICHASRDSAIFLIILFGSLFWFFVFNYCVIISTIGFNRISDATPTLNLVSITLLISHVRQNCAFFVIFKYCSLNLYSSESDSDSNWWFVSLFIDPAYSLWSDNLCGDLFANHFQFLHYWRFVSVYIILILIWDILVLLKIALKNKNWIVNFIKMYFLLNKL